MKKPPHITESDTSHGNANLTGKNPLNSELVKQNPIEGTPFTANKVGDKWFVGLGKYRLTEPMETEQECIEDAKRTDWQRVMQVMWATAQTVIDERGGDYISNQLRLKLAKEKHEQDEKDYAKTEKEIDLSKERD